MDNFICVAIKVVNIINIMIVIIYVNYYIQIKFLLMEFTNSLQQVLMVHLWNLICSLNN